MEKKKNKILTIIATSVLTLATGISLATSIAGLAAIDSSVLVNLSSPTFYATYGSGDAAVPFACFVLNDEEISVAWGSDNPEDTPTDLYVPPTLTNEETGNTYIVKAVQDAGFRYCDFETISLPSSITAIGKEAFAYCVNLKEFYLPQFLTKIESSTFLDCRALKDLYFSSYANISFGNDAPVTSTAGNYYIKEGNTNVLYKKNWTAITSDLEVVTQNGDDFTQVSTTKNYIYNTTTRHLYHLENSAWVRVTSVSFGSAPLPLPQLCIIFKKIMEQELYIQRAGMLKMLLSLNLIMVPLKRQSQERLTMSMKKLIKSISIVQVGQMKVVVTPKHSAIRK